MSEYDHWNATHKPFAILDKTIREVSGFESANEDGRTARHLNMAVAVNAAWNMRIALVIIAAAMIGAGFYVLPIIPAASLLFAGLADQRGGETQWRVASWVAGFGSVAALILFSVL